MAELNSQHLIPIFYSITFEAYKEASSYMDAWLKTSTKNKKQLMINEAVIYSASKCHNGFCILPKILENASFELI